MSSTAETGCESGDGPAFRDQQIFGDYRIVRLLGRGGMGEVYEADDVRSGRRVALKVVNLARSSPVALQRFLREGELAASLSHPNTVYVFGSGEIDGIPFIVTELVTGGTLADRVKDSGPPPVSHAVDAILGVVAGLSAAADLGILHRDVKPSNCFVLDDGSVKIGDFGVSIPLEAQELTQLTLTGVIVGTPSFCAPEQLKGVELDVRTDIYSVGATLFYLLVGRPPFRADNIVQLIEQVVTTAPEAPHHLRSEVPLRLSEIVTACLAKERERRPATYEALAAALRPFCSASLAPAAPAPRALAAVLDALLLVVTWNLTSTFIDLVLRPLPVSNFAMGLLTRTTVTVGYFAVPEYWLGGSLGKLLCGIRVGSDDGSGVTFRSAAARAGLVFAALSVPTPVQVPDGSYFMMSPGPIGVGVAMLLFVTARRSNGYCGIHELLTGSRTWERPAPIESARAQVTKQAPAPLEPAESIGPYRVVRRFAKDPALAFVRDERLKRQVWVRIAAPDEAPVSPARRDLDRPQRFRWLGARRTSAECWDAYEHVEGQPFASLDVPYVPFQTVSRWLLALAQECRAAGADGTLPVIGVNRLWVTPRGEMKVADWPLPGANGDDESYATGDTRSCQQLLVAVAVRAWRLDPAHGPMPTYGRRLLNAAADGSFNDFDDLVAACESAAARDSTVSRERRVTPIVAVTVFTAIPLILVMPTIWRIPILQMQALQRNQLAVCVRELADLQRDAIEDASGARRQAAEMCVAAVSRELDGETLSDFRLKNPNSAPLLDAARVRYPRAAISDLEARLADMPPSFTIERFRRDAVTEMRAGLAEAAVKSGAGATIDLLGVLGLAGIVFALLVREGPLYRMVGIAIVRADGDGVSRPRAVVRAVVVWLPAVAGAAVMQSPSDPETWAIVAASVSVAAMAMAAMVAVWTPARGLPERLTGTWLVRR